MKPGLLKRIFWLCALISACLAGVYPQTPTTLRETYKGRYDFVTTGGTLRAAANSSNACSRVTSSTAAVSGIPASATVFRAYLYWAGSGSAVDANITFDGTNHTADRTYTASLVAGSSTLAYFSGYRDVTAQVAAKRNGSYTFTNLTFTTADQTGAQYCALQGVVGGWGLFVVYQDASLTPKRANIYEGFELVRNSTTNFTLNGLYVPPSPQGRMGVLTFEGDDTLSGSEALRFNGTALTDTLNPANNVFNNTINSANSSTSYGVDLDTFNVASLLNANDRSATASVTTGSDFVILNAVMLAASTNVADLELSSAVSNPTPAEGDTITYNLNLFNRGVNNGTGIQVKNILPAGLTFVSATATNGSFNAATGIWDVNSVSLNGTVTLTITATVNAGTAGTALTDAAEVVFSDNFDPDSPENNGVTTEDDYTAITVNVKPKADLAITKTAAASVNLGQNIVYTIEVTNAGPTNATGLTITDTVPATLSGVSWTCAATGTASCGATSGTGGSISLSGNLNAGAGHKLTLTVTGTTTVAGTVANTANVAAPAALVDSNQTNNSATASTVVGLLISGTVWQDVDGSANGGFTNIQTNAETGTNAGALNAVAVAGGVVLRVGAVAANGTYTIGGIVANTANLTILLTTANPGIGQAAPTPNLPAGWTNTSPLVTAAFSAGTANISGRNFGIEQPPTATGGTAPTLPNPSGAQFSAVPSGIFTGADPDGVVLVFTLTAFPTNATAITVNAANYTSANFPAAGLAINAVSGALPANLLTVDPVDGVVTVQFSFTVSDNAGKLSATATANAPFGAALPPNLQLTKNCAAPADCETQSQLPATDLTYRINFTNAGGQAAQGLIILDKIPANTDFKIGSATATAPVGLTLLVEYSYDYNPSNPAAATWSSAAPASGGGGAGAGYNRLVKALRWRATSGLLNNVAPDNLGNVAFIVKII